MGFSLLRWDRFSSFRGSITRGLRTMLSRGTRGSPSPTYLLCRICRSLHLHNYLCLLWNGWKIICGSYHLLIDDRTFYQLHFLTFLAFNMNSSSLTMEWRSECFPY